MEAAIAPRTGISTASSNKSQMRRYFTASVYLRNLVEVWTADGAGKIMHINKTKLLTFQ